MLNLETIKQEINNQLSDKETFNTLVVTTFKGLNVNCIKRAIFEGMTRGFTFKDFLEKNVYAIPFKDGYSLITSIDYARKIGMRSGVCGVSAPTYDEKDGRIASCSITVKRQVNDYVGEYTATVFFDEYNTGRQQWASKPRTMICKVAEMHALRKACPEELSQSYVEEEMQEIIDVDVIDEKYINEINAIKTIEELKNYYLVNKGRGKDFDKAVTLKKQELQNENL